MRNWNWGGFMDRLTEALRHIVIGLLVITAFIGILVRCGHIEMESEEIREIRNHGISCMQSALHILDKGVLDHDPTYLPKAIGRCLAQVGRGVEQRESLLLICDNAIGAQLCRNEFSYEMLRLEHQDKLTGKEEKGDN